MVDVLLYYESHILFEIVHQTADKVRGAAPAGVAVGTFEVTADIIQWIVFEEFLVGGYD